MKPTLGIVSLLLSDEYEISAGFPVEDDIDFVEYAVYDGEEPRGGVLNVCDCPVGTQAAWRGKLAICLSSQEGQDEVAPGEYHVIARERNAKKRKRAREARFLSFVNAVGRAIRRFDSWALELQQCCLGAPSFREMLRLFETRMGFASVLVNRNLRYLASSDGFAALNPWFSASDTSMGVDMTNQLMADEAFRDAILQREPFFFHYRDSDVDSYSACYNVTSAGRYEARLVVQSPSLARMYGELTLVSYVGDLIADVYVRFISAAAEEPAGSEFNRLLLEIAQGVLVKADTLYEVLSVRGWEADDRLMAHAFSFIEPENESVTRRYYQDRVAHLFTGCAAFQLDGVLYCVRNLSLECRASEEASQDLVIFLRENLCHAGASREFQDVRKLPTYLLEARCALRLGEASQTMQWHFKFEDYALRYIYDQAQREVSWEALVHPAFNKLRLHDELHGTDLLETAHCFMKCKYNVSRAAERLHIHRTSMIARLDRIESVASVDWDNWDDRVHLAMSFDLARFR